MRTNQLGLTLCFLASAGLTGCAARNTASSAAEPAPKLELPESANPAPALAPLAFMTGRWVGVNPNKTVNMEYWTAPRGNHMTALFHQVRRDGKPAFVEVSQIVAGPEGVTLRMRHLHAALEVPDSRKELSVFTLKSAGGDRAEFAGTGAAEGVTSVVYRLVSPNELAVDVNFDPSTKEKGFTSKYVREQDGK
jgi:hypothetical protein